MSGGSKTQTTDTRQETTPWAPAIPAATNILNRANGLLDAGAGSAVYQGPRLAGLGDTTKTGLGQIEQGAAAGRTVAQTGAGLVNGLMGSGGTTAATRGATDAVMRVPGASTAGLANAATRMADPNNAAARVGGAMAGGAYAGDAAGFGQLDAGLAGDSQARRNLGAVARGDFLGEANPYREAMISRGANEAMTAVAQRFAASGRFGSGRFAGAVADSANRIATEARFADYEAERGRQERAVAAIDAADLSRTNQRAGLQSAANETLARNAGLAYQGAGLSSAADAAALTGAQSLFDATTRNNTQALTQATTALQSAQADRQAGLAASALVPTMQQALLSPGETLTKVGATYDAARQDEINAGRELFDETQAAPWKPLGLAASLVYPGAGLGGVSVGTETKKVPQASFLQQMLGLALAGADTASKFYGK